MRTENKIKNLQNFNKKLVIYDIEVYPNFFLVVFQTEQEIIVYTAAELEALKNFIDDPELVLIGYNNLSYDDLILKGISKGYFKTEEDIYNFSQIIINEGKNNRLFNNLKWRTPVAWYKSIDLMQLSFKDDDMAGGKASLKEIAVRLKCRKIQDLPYSFNKDLTEEEKQEVTKYCKNDITITLELWNRLYKSVELRLQLEGLFKVNCITASEAQTAEILLSDLYIRKSGIRPEQLRALRTVYKEICIKDCIAENINFKTAALDDLLSEWKSLKLQFFVDVLQVGPLKREVSIQGKTFALGSGGIHSIDGPAIYTTTEDRIIYDIDVTSYYPSIILNMGLHPGHLTSIWTDILRKITEERIAAKKAGEKLKADSLKIVINSAYGKTGNQYSFMHDQRLMLTVTITGQLTLLMLIEALSEAGIEILSANTDGITAGVKSDRIEKFMNICKAWEINTGFNLEKNIYSKYVRRDVNNYIVKTAEGYIKRKGIFEGWNLFKKNDCKIVSKAIEDYFLNDIPVDETISLKNDQVDIFDYIQSFKAARGFNVYAGELPLQKTNRWYVSNNGGYLLTKKKEDTIIKLADSVKIINEITSKDLPADLNLDFYRQEAKDIIFKIENPVKAEELRNKGLFPIPKEYKYNPSGSKLNEIKADWDYSKKSGIGIYTGPAAGLLAIDIDHPELCQKSTACKYFINTMTTYHGQKAPAEVTGGHVKGTLLYKVIDGLDISSTDKKFAEQHGFEIIYGSKTIQVAGPHPSGEEYKLIGELQELPDSLKTWIINNTKKRKNGKRKTCKQAGNHEDLFEDLHGDLPDAEERDQSEKDLLKKIISEDEHLKNWIYKEQPQCNYSLKLEGSCPWEELHKGKSTNYQFDIIITDNNTLYAGCFHQSCQDEIKKLNYRLNERWLQHFPKENTKNITSTLFSDPGEPAAEFSKISEAFKEEGRVKLIAAPTGSGKTYSSVSYFLSKVAAGEHIIYCTSNKTSMVEFVEAIKDRTGLELKDMAIQQLRSGYNIDENSDDETEMEDQDSTELKDKTIGVITHHTYFGRKGISDLFYSVLNWIDKNRAIVIIDEIDTYIQAQSKIIPLESRYKKLKPKGSDVSHYYRRNKCPSYKGKHNCNACTLGAFPKYEVNMYHIPVFYHLPKVEENDFTLNTIELPDIKIENEIFIQERGLFIKQIEQHKDFLQSKIYKFRIEDGEIFNLKSAIADMIETAYNPVIYNYCPVVNDRPVTTEEELAELSEEDIAKIKYPYMPCMIQYLSLTDKAIPYYLNNAAKEIILLSATISQSNRNYLKECFEDLQEITITESTQKIDELLIIGYGKNFEYIKKDKVLIENFQEFGKVLIFEPNKGEAHFNYERFPHNFPIGCYKQNDVLINEKHENKQYLITHSRGNFGRAINLPEYYTCFIDSNIFKPSNAYNLKDCTLEEIKRLQQDDRITTTIQNAGRILRGTGRKVIAIAHMSKEEIDFIAEKFKVMVNSEINIAHYKDDQKVTLQTIEEYHRTGEVNIYPEEKKIDKAISKGLSGLSHKERSEVKTEYDQVKQQKKIEGKIRLARSLQEDGYTWSKIYKTLNFDRLEKEEVNIIKEAIERVESNG